jgi:uncharacterized Rmd1/YagE family protein
MPRIFTSRASTSSASYMRGRAPLMTRPLHKFIGAAIGTRNEVLSILHMLDKPEAVWEDATADRIYHDLRAEFDLSDRYQALEHSCAACRKRSNSCWTWHAITAWCSSKQRSCY